MDINQTNTNKEEALACESEESTYEPSNNNLVDASKKNKSTIELNGINDSSYKLIVLEGLDCSGKSTVCRLLCEHLQPCKIISFPKRDSVTGKIIDSFLRKEIQVSPYELHLLFSANRYEQMSYIQTELRSSNIICDRYFVSGSIYSESKGLDYEWCRSVDKYLPKPDFTFFIDIKADVTSKRRGFGTEAHDNIELQAKIYNLYLKHAEEENLVFVDGSKSSDFIVADILKKIKK